MTKLENFAIGAAIASVLLGPGTWATRDTMLGTQLSWAIAPIVRTSDAPQQPGRHDAFSAIAFFSAPGFEQLTSAP